MVPRNSKKVQEVEGVWCGNSPINGRHTWSEITSIRIR